MAKNLCEKRADFFNERRHLKEAVMAAEADLIDFDENACLHEILFYMGGESSARLIGNVFVARAYCWQCGKIFTYDVSQGQTVFEVFREKHPNLKGTVVFNDFSFKGLPNDMKKAYIDDVCSVLATTEGIENSDGLLVVLKQYAQIH